MKNVNLILKKRNLLTFINYHHNFFIFNSLNLIKFLDFTNFTHHLVINVSFFIFYFQTSRKDLDRIYHFNLTQKIIPPYKRMVVNYQIHYFDN